MSELFELKPRWPGAPSICIALNLPAFATRRDAKAFEDKYHPSVHGELIECDSCGFFHNGAANAEPIPAKYGDGSKPWNEPETNL